MSGAPEESEQLERALRNLPAVGEVMAQPPLARAAETMARKLVLAIAREAVEQCRASIRRAAREGNGAALERTGSMEAVVEKCQNKLDELKRPRLRRVINATGIILHTGLGRGPLAPEAIEAIAAVAGSYCNLEISRARGGRRKRWLIVGDLLRALTGCEAAAVVNNNAGATLLVLAAHARGREVLVSRGQLVEIGGSFRLPDVMAQAGVTLREVGTTNRTRLADYANAIGENTAAILRIHPSNFRVVGFTESVEMKPLADLAHQNGLIAMDDVGSGSLVDPARYGLEGETIVPASLQAGADLVFFSADKLLGGPQAGVILGKSDAIAACENHPLMRALRVGKLTLAALEATLRLYLEPSRLAERLPTLRMIAEDPDAVHQRADRLAAAIQSRNANLIVDIRADDAYAGGGSLPGLGLPSWVVAIPHAPGGAERAKRRLRLGEPSVFCRVRADRLEFDLRTVRNEEIDEIAQALRVAFEDQAG